MDAKTFEIESKRIDAYRNIDNRIKELEELIKTIKLCHINENTCLWVDCGVNYSDGKNRVKNQDDVIALCNQFETVVLCRIEHLVRMKKEI